MILLHGWWAYVLWSPSNAMVGWKFHFVNLCRALGFRGSIFFKLKSLFLSNFQFGSYWVWGCIALKKKRGIIMEMKMQYWEGTPYLCYFSFFNVVGIWHSLFICIYVSKFILEKSKQAQVSISFLASSMLQVLILLMFQMLQVNVKRLQCKFC
jgi:hypothetical protein